MVWHLPCSEQNRPKSAAPSSSSSSSGLGFIDKWNLGNGRGLQSPWEFPKALTEYLLCARHLA